MQSTQYDNSTSLTLRTGDPCPHYGDCGGCSAQDVAYGEQLRRKATYLQDILAPYWHEPIEVVPSPETWHYRNKVDLNFARRQYDEPPPKDCIRETVLGYNRKGKWYWPLDIEQCSIAPPRTDAILRAVREWYRERGVHAVDQRSGEGVLRALLVREGRRTGECMVMLCTNEGDVDTESFVCALDPAGPIDSVYRGIGTGRAQGAFAERLELLAGAPYIHEELSVGERRYRFRLSPLSFFQTNTLATELLYSDIRDWVRTTAPSLLYDLYGGAGGIAIACADLVDTVRCVDNVPEATADGEANVALNGADNVFFAMADMKHYLAYLRDNGGMEPGSAAILDPSRAGLNPKVIRRFLATNPERFLYVSCNPKVFAQELPALVNEFRLESVKAFDLFPHTPHVELVSAFARM
jgi:23S rRNA (uracil1939-C5)-methyltransferase